MTQRHRRAPRLSLLGWVFCALVGVALIGIWDSQEQTVDAPGRAGSTTAPDPVPTPAPTPAEPHRSGRPGPHHHSVVPVTLDIPTIDLSTPLVRLGLLADRTVEVPADADLAGWFRRGPEPGRRGSSVILGHVDSEEGPAIFARLYELGRGDAVTVGRADGSVVEFVVTKAVIYPNAAFPAQRVYAAQGARRLNLVTCAGDYDPDRGGYQSNLVVYTHRVVSSRSG